MSQCTYLTKKKPLLLTNAFKRFLKWSTDVAILILKGRLFHGLGAEATKVRSPKVVEVLKFCCDSSIPLSDRKPYLV